MTFDLAEIRAVFFRCNECHSAVSFPRIRWASLPECCPNCGAEWMQEPGADLAFPDNDAIRAFKAAKAFRDALQALIGAAHMASFRIGLETAEPQASDETVVSPAEPTPIV